LNRMISVTDASGRTEYTYALNGKPETVVNPNGTWVAYAYDSLGRLLYLENSGSEGVMSSYAYTLDAAGNRTRVVENTGRTVEYGYDILNRLTSETVNDGTSRSYVHDAVGNRLSMTVCVDTDCETTSYTYNLNNQLLTAATGAEVTQYFYDSSGNTVEKSGGGSLVTYEYDAQNRLVEVDSGDRVVEFGYDADGARVEKVVDGEAVRYLLDTNRRYHQVLEEQDASGALMASYTMGHQRVSMRREGTQVFYLYDGLGSVTGLADSMGTVTDTYTYEAFGQMLTSGGDFDNPYGYTGEYRDAETGLLYLRARYLDPGVGRFVTLDTHPGNAQMPVSLNKYLYGNANPVMYVDPSGEISLVNLMMTVSVGAVLTTTAVPGRAISSTACIYKGRGQMVYIVGGEINEILECVIVEYDSEYIDDYFDCISMFINDRN
jgi:RHS repeat-associated protein